MRGSRLPACAGLVLVALFSAAPGSPARAQHNGTISGSVVTAAGEAVTDAAVTLLELRRRTSVDGEGRFQFEEVPPGAYLLEARSSRAGSAVERVEVAAAAEARVELTLGLARHSEAIVVTASAEARGRLDLAQATNVLSGQDLILRLQPTLGETLNQEPGVASTFFGAGASRPVIRGLGGDRVRMLEGGLGTGDVSSTSPDHAVAVDPLAADRIEVIRGPATLLYGSSAIGGVVNVIDDRIPDLRPLRRLSGRLDVRAGTADDERAGALSLTGGAGRWAWGLGLLTRDTDDYEIPGFARRADEHGEGEGHGEDGGEENPFGVLPNSDIDSDGGNLGVSFFFGDQGFLGVSVAGLATNYGVPGLGEGEHGEGDGEVVGEQEESGEEGGIRIDMEQRRVDLRGEVTRPFGAFRGLKVRFGLTDYEHAEVEPGGEVGTRFFNDAWETRVELVQKPRGSLRGSFGLQLRDGDLEAAGEEAFLPPAESLNLAVFAFEEIERGPVTLQFGGRFERQDTTTAGAGLPDRSFEGLSGSLGVVWKPSSAFSFAASLARSVKMPNSEELYSNGAHFATRAFEIGDPSLGEETSLGLDVALRKETGRLTGELSLFLNRFDGFIFQAFTGEEREELPVLRYSQGDAEFLGAELRAQVELVEAASHHLHLRLLGDYVEAELRHTGEPLPRIPPLRLGVGLHYHGERWMAMAEVRRVEQQDEVAREETPTGGYTLLNAAVSYRFFFGEQILDLLLRGRNLTDEEARNHLSFLKDVAPLPGRDVSLSLRLSF